MSETDSLGVWTFLERTARIASSLLIPIILWGISVELRIAKLPDEIHRTTDAKLSVLKLPPPDWFRDNVLEIKGQGIENRKAIQDLSQQVTSLNAKFDALRTLLREQ